MAEPTITKLEVHQYAYTLEELGTADNGFNLVYSPGSHVSMKGHILRILTDVGLVGEYAGGGAAEYSTLPTIAQYLIGKHALERERIYTDVKRALRQVEQRLSDLSNPPEPPTAPVTESPREVPRWP